MAEVFVSHGRFVVRMGIPARHPTLHVLYWNEENQNLEAVEVAWPAADALAPDETRRMREILVDRARGGQL